MAKMMRALVVLAGLCFASGENSVECALSATGAVDEMLDSAVYIMASLVRCTPGHNDTNAIACALDVSSAIESVNGMINIIMKSVDNCNALKKDNHKCGMAVGVLTRSFAGLSAASAGIIARCPNKLNGGKAIDTVGERMEDANRYGGDHQSFKTAGLSAGYGQCLVNIKDVIKSLTLAIKRTMTIGVNCEDPNSSHCAHNSIKIVSSFTALGEYLAGAIGKCEAQTNANALCAQMALRLTRQTENVARAAVAMSQDCNIGAAERLYLEEAEDAAPASSDKASSALMALLPLTAVVAFVGGSRFARNRAQVADSELLVQE